MIALVIFQNIFKMDFKFHIILPLHGTVAIILQERPFSFGKINVSNFAILRQIKVDS